MTVRSGAVRVGATRGRSKLLSLAVRDEILSRIQRGAIPPNAQLPPEPELASELSVSRATLREALRLLEDEGLVTRTRGAGTFVSGRPKVANNLDANFGVTEAIRRSGMRPGYEQGVSRIEPASPDEAERLGLSPGERILVVDRIRTADGRPVVYSRDLLPERLSERLFEGRSNLTQRLIRGSVYEVLERSLGIVIHHGVASFRPERASRRVAARLRVPPGTLVLYLRQVDFDAEGRPVLSSHEHHLAAAFEFTVVRRGPGRRFA